MKLTFLGTGAADWPKVRESEFHRYLSSALVNDDLLIDPGPCIFSFQADMGRPLFTGVKNVILTHSHGDHYNAGTLLALCEAGPITFYATAEVAQVVPKSPNLTYVPITPFVPFTVGDYEIMPVPSSHSTSIPEETPVNYVITQGNKCLFYGLDGAWIPNKSYHALKTFAFDAMVFDCTSGEVDGEFRIFEHNTIPMLEYLLHHMRLAFPTMFKPGCKLIATHMARTLHGTHEETAARLAKFGMLAAYDGFEAEI